MAFDLDDEENKATRKMNGASKERKDENMDIEVGEYVRTKDGKIDKVINSNFYMGIYVECEKGLYLIKNMVKHSKQLIDLIEVGDIVNEFLVLDIETVLKTGEGKALDIGHGNYIFDDEIKTILTKERYIDNCYKAGGEE